MPGFPDCPREITPEIVAGLKQALAETGLSDRVFKFDLDGQAVVFRPLFRKDWLEIQAYVKTNQGQVTPENLEQQICQKTILWPLAILHPIHWERQPAGLQRTLAQYIQARSGFLDPDMDQSAYLRFEPLLVPENGPRPDERVIEQLKARHSQWSLKLALIEGEHYVVRPIARGEWRQITQAGEDADFNLLTAQQATVWSREFPEKPDFNTRVAGTVQTLSDAIMRASGFLVEPVIEEL